MQNKTDAFKFIMYLSFEIFASFQNKVEEKTFFFISLQKKSILFRSFMQI